MLLWERSAPGGPEIDMIWSTGTWVAAVEARAGGASHREMMRYRPAQPARLQNPFKQPGCIFHAGSPDVVESCFFEKDPYSYHCP